MRSEGHTRLERLLPANARVGERAESRLGYDKRDSQVAPARRFKPSDGLPTR
jgi:hypothetical protein